MWTTRGVSPASSGGPRPPLLTWEHNWHDDTGGLASSPSSSLSHSPSAMSWGSFPNKLLALEPSSPCLLLGGPKLRPRCHENQTSCSCHVASVFRGSVVPCPTHSAHFHTQKRGRPSSYLALRFLVGDSTFPRLSKPHYQEVLSYLSPRFLLLLQRQLCPGRSVRVP